MSKKQRKARLNKLNKALRVGSYCRLKAKLATGAKMSIYLNNSNFSIRTVINSDGKPKEINILLGDESEADLFN